jgi:hypothetical protein
MSSLKTLKGLVADAARDENSSLLSKPRTVPVTVADQVVVVLTKKMQEYAAVGKLAEFNSIITRALEKVTALKNSVTNKKTLQTLSEIEVGIRSFQ